MATSSELMKTYASVEELHADMKKQGVDDPRDIAFKCVMCQTVQSARDFIAAGVGDWERYIGFSCVGRFTGAAQPRQKPDGQPCNWTLGGLFKVHKAEVLIQGRPHPIFLLATPKEAQAHANQ